MSDDRMPPEHPPVMLLSSRDAPSVAPRPEVRKPALQDAQVTIDVLVAFTSRAARYYSDIRQELIELAVEEANEFFRISKLGHVRVRLVHALETDYEEQGSHFDHLWRFADKGDGFLEEIGGIRDRTAADIAVLVVHDPVGCGFSTRVGAEAEEAFAVVHHECAQSSYSLAHEIGHIIGARHDVALDDSNEPFAFGHGLVTPQWRTMMSYKNACNGCPRMPFWSNPKVVIEGDPAGSANEDNARVIAEQAVRVASFR